MKEILRLCLVLTLVAAVSAGVLAFVSRRTAEPIARALLEERMSAVRDVLPPFDNDPNADRVAIEVEDAAPVEIYRGRMGQALTGVAFPIKAPDGYSGDIVFMLGVDTAGVVTGLRILQHLETPGLGAKIEDAAFRDQYRGASLADPEVWAVTKDGGIFVPITGATISSRAVTAATERGLQFFGAHRDEILGAGAGLVDDPVAPGAHGAPDDPVAPGDHGAPGADSTAAGAQEAADPLEAGAADRREDRR